MHEHADSKAWWHLATGCTIEHYLEREDALARERYLIETWRPPFNNQHNPDRDTPVPERMATLPSGARIPTEGIWTPGETVARSKNPR